jgi:RHS repeat-associated protein
VSTSGGLVSNDLVAAVEYPDPSTGSPSSSSEDTYTYNQLGQVLTKTDRNGTVHTYTYDVVGRLTADAVTTLGTGVDGTVRRIEYAYDGQGNQYLITSYDSASGGSVVNQVQRAFNGLGQLTQEWQATSGSVNTSTTPSVQYAYSFAPSGSTNHSRLTSITYPNGRVVTYNYASGLADTISRLSSITDGSTTLEGYDYLGLGTVVTRSHPQTGVDLTYVKFSGESNGAAGDQYTGLDAFGRVIDQRWTTSGGTAADRRQSGYDRDSNRLYALNTVSTSNSELYAYDGLNQLTSFQRGTLNGTNNGLTGSATRSQSWTSDAVGNFATQVSDGTTQTRSANKQNEITSVSGATTPTYDAAGDMTGDEAGRQFVYDAWGRLVVVKNSGGATLATYRYDGLNRRVRDIEASTTDLYYSDQWQVLEEDVSGSAVNSYAWSPVYVDALIARDSGGTRLYAVQDANWNVVGLVNTSGNVVERYGYDSYGSQTVTDGSWNTRSGSSYTWTYGFQGRPFDAAAGGYNFRNREEDPVLGRWGRDDPAGSRSDSHNLFLFEGDNPATYTDAQGLWRLNLHVGLPPMSWPPVIAAVGVPAMGLLPAPVAVAGAVVWPAAVVAGNQIAKVGGPLLRRIPVVGKGFNALGRQIGAAAAWIGRNGVSGFDVSVVGGPGLGIQSIEGGLFGGVGNGPQIGLTYLPDAQPQPVGTPNVSVNMAIAIPVQIPKGRKLFIPLASRDVAWIKILPAAGPFLPNQFPVLPWGPGLVLAIEYESGIGVGAFFPPGKLGVDFGVGGNLFQF